MAKSFSAVLLIVFLCVLFTKIESVRPRFQHFEDYINSLDRRDQSWINDATQRPVTADEDEEEKDEDVFDEDITTNTPTTTTEAPTTTPGRVLSLQQTREVTCCLLGQIAGDKGYHCYVQYYAARLILRNRNRAHNRKMNFYGRDRIPHYGEKVMRTFEQCVAGMGQIFHKCCHLASQEKRPYRYDTVARARAQRTHHHHHHSTTQSQVEDDDN